MRGRDPIVMDSGGKRRRGHDRLSNLPDSILHIILSGLGSRQSVQTSALSRRWRQLWRDVPCADIDEREFTADAWERFEDFADHMLTSIPPGTQIDAFRLHLVRCKSGSDRWIRRGFQHVPAAVHIRAPHSRAVIWQPHVWMSPDPSVPIPSTCLCAAGFTRRLTTLHLVGVDIVGFVENLHEYCPVIEDLHLERCTMYLDAVASPTLRSLSVVDPYLHSDAGPPRITAPRLAVIRLEIWGKGQGYYGKAVCDPEPLELLAEASIRLMEKGQERLNQLEIQDRKIYFLESMCRFLALLPNVVNLHLSGYTITAFLGEESLEFPVLHNLKALILENCDIGQNFQALTSILWKTRKLEKLGLHHCKFLAPQDLKRRKRRATFKHYDSSSLLWYKNMKSIEINLQQEDAPHVVKILSEISKGMPTAQWLKIKTSRTFL